MWAVAGCAHHGDDLLNLRRIGRVRRPLLRGDRPAWVNPRENHIATLLRDRRVHIACGQDSVTHPAGAELWSP